MNLKFPPSTTTWKPPLEIMDEETSMNVWKESFPIEIRFLMRNNDLRKVAGNWTWPGTGPHTVPFSDQKCVELHTSRPDQLLCLTAIVSCSAEGHFRLWKQQDVPLISLRSTEDLQVYWDLMMSLNYQTAQIKAKTHATQCRSCLLAREISYDRWVL